MGNLVNLAGAGYVKTCYRVSSFFSTIDLTRLPVVSELPRLRKCAHKSTMSIVAYGTGVGPGTIVGALLSIAAEVNQLAEWYDRNQQLIGNAQHVVVSGANAISQTVQDIYERIPRAPPGQRLRIRDNGNLATQAPAPVAETPVQKRVRQSQPISPALRDGSVLNRRSGFVWGSVDVRRRRRFRRSNRRIISRLGRRRWFRRY